MTAVAENTGITAEDIPNLLTVEDAYNRLAETKFTGSVKFTADGSSNARINLVEGYNADLKDRDGEEILDATLEVGSNILFLSKDALLDLSAQMGISRDYMSRTPAELIEPHLNYWLKNLGKDFRVLRSGDNALALSRSASVVPFNNEQILDTLVQKITDTGLGDAESLRVDYKFQHDLHRTAFRLIVPGHQRTIHSARAGGSEDVWNIGIQVRNSLTGQFITQMHGYLFAWWCTNGSITKHTESAKFNRRVRGQDEEEMLAWVSESGEAILADLPHQLEEVESLNNVNLSGELGNTLIDVLHRTQVPLRLRESVLSFASDMDDITAYGLMNAITQSANAEGVKDHMREKVMEIGGEMIHAFGNRCSTCHRLPIGD